MSLGRLGGGNHLCSRSGSGSGSQQPGVWCAHTTGGSSCTIASRGRERGFWKSCEVRHVMEDQSLPLASWKQVREWKFQPPPGVCGAARQPVAPLCFSRLSVFFRKCVKCCGVRQCPRGVMALQTLNLLLGKLRASSSDRCFITSCITQAAPQRSGSWSNSNPMTP